MISIPSFSHLYLLLFILFIECNKILFCSSQNMENDVSLAEKVWCVYMLQSCSLCYLYISEIILLMCLFCVIVSSALVNRSTAGITCVVRSVHSQSVSPEGKGCLAQRTSDNSYQLGSNDWPLSDSQRRHSKPPPSWETSSSYVNHSSLWTYCSSNLLYILHVLKWYNITIMY